MTEKAAQSKAITCPRWCFPHCPCTHLVRFWWFFFFLNSDSDSVGQAQAGPKFCISGYHAIAGCEPSIE